MRSTASSRSWGCSSGANNFGAPLRHVDVLTYTINGLRMPATARELKARTVRQPSRAGQENFDWLQELAKRPSVAAAIALLKRLDGGVLGVLAPDRRAINVAVLSGGARLALTKRGFRIPGVGTFGQTSFPPQADELGNLNRHQVELSLQRLAEAIGEGANLAGLRAATMIADTYVVRSH